jgi:hypothetical protein
MNSALPLELQKRLFCEVPSGRVAVFAHPDQMLLPGGWRVISYGHY